jgi:hypothetical protein
MKKIFLSIFCLLSLLTFAQNKDLQFYYGQAQEAYKNKSYQKFYEMMKEVRALRPAHQGVLYQFGLAAALTGHKAEAIENLKKALLIDTSFKLDGLSDFNSIKDTPEFHALLDLQREWDRPVIHSDTAFVIADRSLHTEGIEYDAAHKDFYLGSIHKRKIIKVSVNGTVSNFCSSGFEGMTSIFGLKIDAQKNILWACSSPMHEMENYDSSARSAVFKLDLNTGKFIEKFKRPSWERDGVFGDLILNKKGEVFVSDSQNNIIFKVNEQTHQLETFSSSPDFQNIQGMAFSDNEKYLFISDYKTGLLRLELKTKTLATITCSLDVSIKGIDGLNFYKNSLIAFQNGVSPLRVTRYFLNDSQTAISRFEIIDRKHPAFGEPTMGVIHDADLYYIANSQWGGYDDNHQIKPNDQLQDIVVLKYKLTK